MEDNFGLNIPEKDNIRIYQKIIQMITKSSLHSNTINTCHFKTYLLFTCFLIPKRIISIMTWQTKVKPVEQKFGSNLGSKGCFAGNDIKFNI